MAALLAGGLLAGGTATSSAQEASTSSADGDGLLAGNALRVDLDIPITVCGVLANLLGMSLGDCIVTGIQTPDDGRVSASGDGIASGNAINLDVDLPITVSSPQPPPVGTCCPPPTPAACCVPTTVCCVPPPTCCVPPPPESPPPPITPPELPPPALAAVPVAQPQMAVAAQLPITGTATTRLVFAGVGSLLAGGLLLMIARRSRTRFRPLP